MPDESVRLIGHLTLEITAGDGSGEVIARSDYRNTVVDGGRRLLAQLLSGEAAAPQFAIVAGIDGRDTLPDLTKLFNTDGLNPATAKRQAASPGQVKLKGSFPKADKERLIQEAGLMLTCTVGQTQISTLYNRVLVKPAQTVRADEVLSLTWTLSFAAAAN